jgi:hypothetical protein
MSQCQYHELLMLNSMLQIIVLLYLEGKDISAVLKQIEKAAIFVTHTSESSLLFVMF